MNWSHVRTSVDALYNLLFYVEAVVDWHRNAVDFEYPPSHLQVSQRRPWPSAGEYGVAEESTLTPRSSDAEPAPKQSCTNGSAKPSGGCRVPASTLTTSLPMD
jgi:hypothetical protein